MHIDTSLELHLMETWTLPGYIKFGDTRHDTGRNQRSTSTLALFFAGWFWVDKPD